MTATTNRPRTRKSYDGPTPEEKLAADLIALMEQGVNPWRRPWVGTQGEHRNLLTGHQYRGGNPLLLEVGNLSRGNTLPLWMGAAQAKANGWHPAKGSKAARIAQPRPVTIEDDNAQLGEISTKARSFTVYKLVRVFNAADLVGVDDNSAAALARRIDAATGNIQQRPEPERLAYAEDVLTAWDVKAQLGGSLACYSVDRVPSTAANTSPRPGPMKRSTAPATKIGWPVTWAAPMAARPTPGKSSSPRWAARFFAAGCRSAQSSRITPTIWAAGVRSCARTRGPCSRPWALPKRRPT
jgi:hypothetical protein